MSDPSKRLLLPSQLPTSLWESASETLQLPEALANAYVVHIDRLGLRNLANARSDDRGPVGGPSKESADQHFAQSFGGSAARAMLALLDPNFEGGSTSDSFITSTAGTSLALTDAPCGAGAAALAFLSTIAELRAKEVLPRYPLDVKLVGGELSPHAIDHARQLFADLHTDLERQAIFVHPQFHRWDVLDGVSTADLVKASTVHGASCASRLLVIANFNGFLVKERKQKEAQPQLDELLRYASGGRSLAVWIEPDMNRATSKGGLFSWLFGQFQASWQRFGKVDAAATADQPVYCTAAKFRLPLQPHATARVTLAVMPINLSRGTSK